MAILLKQREWGMTSNLAALIALNKVIPHRNYFT
jgi:hypothetical protein